MCCYLPNHLAKQLIRMHSRNFNMTVKKSGMPKPCVFPGLVRMENFEFWIFSRDAIIELEIFRQEG
jgi:hypothetical protein